MRLKSRLAAGAVSLAAIAIAQAGPAHAQNPPQPRPPQQAGISTTGYYPLDPRKHPDQNPLEVKPTQLNMYYQRDGSLRCTPPDPTWRLLEQYAVSCLYAVPLIPAERKVLEGYAVVPASTREQRERTGGHCLGDPWNDSLLVCNGSADSVPPVIVDRPAPPLPQPGDPYAGVPGYIPGGYNPCFNPRRPRQCPSQTAENPRPTGGGGTGSGPTPADEVLLCGVPTIVSSDIADVDHYVKAGTALTDAEQAQVIQKGELASPQGDTPWCGLASAKVILRVWRLSNGADLPVLAGELDGMIKGSGQPGDAQHGYRLDQIGKLLASKGLQTQESDASRAADPIGALDQATQKAPVIVGITFTDVSKGRFGRPRVSLGRHAIVVDRVEGRAPNRQVVIIDSVIRKMGGSWTLYYKEPEAEFREVWQLDGTRPFLQSHPPGR
jgi:hypothetical protein